MGHTRFSVTEEILSQQTCFSRKWTAHAAWLVINHGITAQNGHITEFPDIIKKGNVLHAYQ